MRLLRVSFFIRPRKCHASHKSGKLNYFFFVVYVSHGIHTIQIFFSNRAVNDKYIDPSTNTIVHLVSKKFPDIEYRFFFLFSKFKNLIMYRPSDKTHVITTIFNLFRLNKLFVIQMQGMWFIFTRAQCSFSKQITFK